jgi:hypothetical protein
LQPISDLEQLFFRVFTWFEREKGPLPIKPALVIFKEKTGYLDFLQQNRQNSICNIFDSPEQDIKSDASTLFKMENGKLMVTIAVQNSLSKATLFVQICTFIHELCHVYEATKNGKITFHIMESPNETKNREIKIYMESLNLAEEYFGKPIPRWVKDYVLARLKKELK